MSSKHARWTRPEIAEPTRSSERADTLPASPEVRRVGRLRLPLAGPYRPWATLYRYPDGRTYWVVRLWEVDRPVRRVYTTATVRAWASGQGLCALLAAIDALVADLPG
jgi:hypothetical protein